MQCVYVSATFAGHPTLSFPPCAHKSVLYISIPSLQMGSSIPFFWIPYMCINILYLFFSFWLKTALCITGSRFIHLTKTDSHLFLLYGWEMGFPGGASGKEPACQCRRRERHRFHPWVRGIPWMRTWKLTPVFLPGESPGQRSLVGYDSEGRRVRHDRSDLVHSHTWLSDIPLCMCTTLFCPSICWWTSRLLSTFRIFKCAQKTTQQPLWTLLYMRITLFQTQTFLKVSF